MYIRNCSGASSSRYSKINDLDCVCRPFLNSSGHFQWVNETKTVCILSWCWLTKRGQIVAKTLQLQSLSCVWGKKMQCKSYLVINPWKSFGLGMHGPSCCLQEDISETWSMCPSWNSWTLLSIMTDILLTESEGAEDVHGSRFYSSCIASEADILEQKVLSYKKCPKCSDFCRCFAQLG